MELVTPRLRLRRARPGDLADLHAVLSHPLAMRYWSTPPHAGMDETRAWLEETIAASPEESDEFVIERDGRVIGKAGCWRLPEIGFILHPDTWRRGFAREALEAVIPRLFAIFPIEAILADVDPRNAGSLALLAGLGFRETGRAKRTFKVGDEWCDSLYLSLPRPVAFSGEAS
ncbi:MAG TPA: GNAT family N-acetyltransferase [Caulobacteraceae bacterium]